METLQLRDIACYLPYKLKLKSGTMVETMTGIEYNQGLIHFGEGEYDWFNCGNLVKPILRPISDLYKPLEDGTIPIVELAKIFSPHYEWELRKDFVEAKTGGGIYTFEFDEGYNIFLADNSANCVNQIQLFDYINKHHFDYRNLIQRNLAIDINTI